MCILYKDHKEYHAEKATQKKKQVSDVQMRAICDVINGVSLPVTFQNEIRDKLYPDCGSTEKGCRWRRRGVGFQLAYILGRLLCPKYLSRRPWTRTVTSSSRSSNPPSPFGVPKSRGSLPIPMEYNWHYYVTSNPLLKQYPIPVKIPSPSPRSPYAHHSPPPPPALQRVIKLICARCCVLLQCRDLWGEWSC